MPQPTKEIAQEIVEGLRGELSGCDLPTIRSIFVAGSYVRGDWLDGSSDLDLNILLVPGFQGSVEGDAGYGRVRSIARRILGGRSFPSQCPGGIDWSIHSNFSLRFRASRKLPPS